MSQLWGGDEAVGKTGLVIGYGSIGRRHARILKEFTPSLAIVNRREAARAQAQQDHPSACVVDGLDALDRVGFPWPSVIAVIATWAPSHSDLFHKLVDRGVRHILCEKPMAASVEQAATMAQRAEEDGITLGVNHCLRYADLVPSLRRFLESNHLGEPVLVVVRGGAGCLVTNGIHWIDFAIELFGADPEVVVGIVQGEAINPRSTELLNFGGGAVWRFPGDRETVILLSNASSIEPVVRVYLPGSFADLSYAAAAADDVVVESAVWRAVPRRGDESTEPQPAGEPLFAGRLPGVRLFRDGIRAAMNDVLNGRATRSPGNIGVTAVSAVVGALASAEEQTAITLPIQPSSPRGRHQWPMS